MGLNLAAAAAQRGPRVKTGARAQRAPRENFAFCKKLFGLISEIPTRVRRLIEKFRVRSEFIFVPEVVHDMIPTGTVLHRLPPRAYCAARGSATYQEFILYGRAVQ